ncbi:MAG TPA: NADH-quinone oxidoreductase subunit A [Polyangia bacterium]
MLFDLASIFFFVVVGISVPLLMLTLGWLVRPHTPNPEKLATYECGELPTQAAWFNFNPRFYIVALVFLVFDVEVAFTYPVAVAFRRWVAVGAGSVAFVELAVFVGILVLGLAYVWRRGDLDWIRDER